MWYHIPNMASRYVQGLKYRGELQWNICSQKLSLYCYWNVQVSRLSLLTWITNSYTNYIKFGQHINCPKVSCFWSVYFILYFLPNNNNPFSPRYVVKLSTSVTFPKTTKAKMDYSGDRRQKNKAIKKSSMYLACLSLLFHKCYSCGVLKESEPARPS